MDALVFDDQDRTDGTIATAAVPAVIGEGEEVHFAGDYRTPGGTILSWDALPRCDSAAGVAYHALHLDVRFLTVSYAG